MVDIKLYKQVWRILKEKTSEFGNILNIGFGIKRKEEEGTKQAQKMP